MDSSSTRTPQQSGEHSGKHSYAHPTAQQRPAAGAFAKRLITVATAGVGTIALSASLVSCDKDQDQVSNEITPSEVLEVTTSTTPTFEPKQVEPSETTELVKSAHDEGLNVTYTLQGVRYAPNGGSLIYVLITNDNDVPLPPEALSPVILKITDGAGGWIDIDRIADENSGVQSGLDLPLGAHASTNLKYVFDVNTAALWKAKLQIGNVIYDGNLNVNP